MASNFRITLSNLASVVMESFIEWRPLLEEIDLEFLDSSGVGSHWMVFPLGLHIFSTPHVHLLSRISLTQYLEESYFDNLDHHKGFGIAATCLCHAEGIGQEGL